MKQPLISVIIPVYNVEKYLKKCVNSVIKQTYHNLEIILIDDGSTDGSGEICDSFKDERIIVHHQKNLGLSGARNAGIKMCSGDFITFVDADDFIEKDMVEYLLGLIKKFSADMSICAICDWKTNKNKKSSGKGFRDKIFKTENCLEAMLLEDGFTMSACGKLYPREFFKSVKFPEGKLHEDVGTTYKLIMEAKKIAYGHLAKYNYVVRNTSITHQFNEQKMDLIELTDKMSLELEKKFPELEDVLRKRKMHARFSILRQLPNGHKEEQKIKKYLLEHRDDIFKNPKADKRDKVAMMTLLMGLPVFKNSWKIYEKLK